MLVAAELIAADAGMGFMIMNARQTAEVGVIVFGILLIGLATLATDWALGLVDPALGRTMARSVNHQRRRRRWTTNADS